MNPIRNKVIPLSFFLISKGSFFIISTSSLSSSVAQWVGNGKSRRVPRPFAFFAKGGSSHSFIERIHSLETHSRMRGLLERVALRSLKIHKGSAHPSAPDTCASIHVDPWRKECFSLQLGAESLEPGCPSRASSACGTESIAPRERVTHTASLAEC